MAPTPVRTTSLVTALAALAGPAQAAEFSVDAQTTLSVYGTVEPKLIADKDVGGDTQSKFADEDSTLGVAAENALGGGITAFGQAEFEFTADADNGSGGFDNTDSAFAGLKGSFGKVRIGHFDGVYEDDIIDATEIAEDAEITDERVSSEDNQLAYYSPRFAGGFSVQGQVRYFGDKEAGNPTGDTGVGVALVGSYSGATWNVHLGYDDTGAELVDQFGANGNVTGRDFADEGTLGTSGIVELGACELAGKYAVEFREDNDPLGDQRTFTALRASYGFDHTDVWTAVQRVAVDADEDRTEVTAGIEYALAENLTLWSELGRFDRRNDTGDNFNIGAIYSF